MSNSKQSDVEKQQFWQLVLEEHANRQMSVRNFCFLVTYKSFLCLCEFAHWRTLRNCTSLYVNAGRLQKFRTQRASGYPWQTTLKSPPPIYHQH